MTLPLPAWLQISPRAALAVGIVLTVLVGAFLVQIDLPLRTAEAPWGIVSLELAWTTQVADAILAEWSAQGALEYARLGLVVDLVFPFLYAGTLALACRTVAQGPRAPWPRLGRLAAIAALACIPLDLIENVFLMRIIAVGVDAPSVLAGSLAASLKFFLIAFVLISLVACGMMRSSRRANTQ